VAECIFCDIVSGKIPCARVYEDDYILSFLDIGPLAEGHLLVIPKQHIEYIWQADAELLSRLARAIPSLAAAVMKATGAEGLNLLQNNGRAAGQLVQHLHIHLIPRRSGDGLGYRWNARRYAEGRMEKVQREIVRALTGRPGG